MNIIKNKLYWTGAIIVLICSFIIPCVSWAAFGEDREKPEPVFTSEGNKITAKYIPRAKSTSVVVDFEVTGGKLVQVKGMDFYLAKRPEVDVKDFKSALFTIEIKDIAPGAEVKVSATSDFFTKSTEYLIFNEKLQTPWMNSNAENVVLSGLVRALVITVKDGGEFDADGTADGKIFVVGGPKDSFWGYAMGTLFIRFFGVFIVLSVLMIGMIFSGLIFQYMDKKDAEKIESKPKEEIKPDQAKEDISPEVVAAIALTLDMHFKSLRPSFSCDLSNPQQMTAWAQNGREKCMGERFLVFNRDIRKG